MLDLEEVYRVIGEKVKRERERQGLSRAQLRCKLRAIGCPLGESTFHRIETGLSCSIPTLSIMAFGLGVPLCEFFVWVGVDAEIDQG